MVPAGALACPECGSDDETGWSGNRLYDQLDLPGPGYGREQPPARTKAWFWKLVTIGVLILLGLLILLGGW